MPLDNVMLPAFPTDGIYKQGSRGDDVWSIQNQLKYLGFDPGGLDGIYGPNTAEALKRFQSAAGITADGIYGPQTRAAITNYKPGVNGDTSWYRSPGGYNPLMGDMMTNPALRETTQPGPTVNPPQPPPGPPNTNPPTGGTPTVAPTGPVTDIPATGGTDPFTYDPATDPEYQAAARELNRQIANAMNRRGIYGSTIMSQDLSSAQANLIGDYREQAYQNYQQKLADKQDALDRAYENARRRGYYNNEEAALWGVPPGTRITSSSSGGGTTKNDGSTTQSDGTKYDAKGNIVYTTPQKSVVANFKSDFKDDPINQIGFLYEKFKAGVITETMFNDAIDAIGGASYNGKTALQWLEEYFKWIEDGQGFSYDDYVMFRDDGGGSTLPGERNERTGAWDNPTTTPVPLNDYGTENYRRNRNAAW